MDNKIVLISEFTQFIKPKSLTFRMKKILTTVAAVTKTLAFLWDAPDSAHPEHSNRPRALM